MFCDKHKVKAKACLFVCILYLNYMTLNSNMTLSRNTGTKNVHVVSL